MTTAPTSPTADRTWLVAHDFSPCADAAARLALDEAMERSGSARIVLMHAYLVMIPPATVEGTPLATSFTSLEDAVRDEASRALELVAERLRSRAAGRATVEAITRMGPAVETILAAAGEVGADRIVVGTHGRHGVSHFLLGSVAERVVRRASIPVVVAHAALERAPAVERQP